MHAKTVLAGMLMALSAFATGAETVIDIDNAEDLVAKLWEYKGKGLNYVLRLAPGDYNLPDAAMATNTGEYGNGISTLLVDKIKLVGAGTKPEDVKLIGAGNLRVISCANTPWIENLTITNGNATVDYISAGYYNRGGGVFGGCTITNCLITGCKARIGGGMQLSAKLYNCRVENNTATSVGGGTHNVTAYNTVYAGNTAVNDGGGAYSTTLYGCTITNNTSGAGGGGAYSCTIYGGTISHNSTTGSGGGISETTAHDILLEGNTSGSIGGGSYKSTLYGCTVSNNVAGTSGGGIYAGFVHGGTVSHNIAANGSGGGYACSDNATTPWVVTGCVFYANCCSNISTSVASYGGGFYGGINAIASNCTFRGNWARKANSKNPLGGGVARAILCGGTVQDNVCDGYGGGIYSVKAKGVRIFRNRSPGDNSSNNSYYCDLDGCEVSGGEVSGGSAVDTVFHDVGGALTLENPLVSATVSPNYIWTRYPNATNCLFRNCRPGAALFSGVNNANASAHLVNCTIVSNSAEYVFIYFSVAAYPMTVENCVFYGNLYSLNSSARDISHHPNYVTATALRFTHCAYLASSISYDTLRTSYSSDGEVYQFGNDIGADPKFCLASDALHPFSLKRSSPLIGKGAYSEWMASACDIRGTGFARADGTRVDIGCYQCWLKPAGTWLSIR